MGHYWSEVQDDCKATENQLLKEWVQTPMKTKAYTADSTDKLGFTQVWEGKPTEFITISRQWSVVKEDHLIVDSSDYPGNLVLWVANEWIDWSHLRIMKEFRPANTCSTRTSDRLFNHQVMEDKRSLDNATYQDYLNK